jgi:Ankyrin repeats (3 copies)
LKLWVEVDLTYVPPFLWLPSYNSQSKSQHCGKHHSLNIISSTTMPKKSSKKGSKKAAPAAETTLVPHRAPNMTDLLERAKRGKLSDVQQYLSAGGSPNVLVEVLMQDVNPANRSCSTKPVAPEGHFAVPLPLLSSVAAAGHSDAAASIQLLLQAGAAVDAIATGAIVERTALMLASSLSHGLSSVQALLQAGAEPCYQAGSDGMSALHLAAATGCADICMALHNASSGRALEFRGKGDGLLLHL